jgi:hypothetical protein
MKIKILILSLLLGSSIIAQTPSYIPKNGLIGWWPFNGNAYDESGNGNNGTVNGATLTIDRNGKANSAYSFDGVSNYIQCSSDIAQIDTVSISCWIYLNNTQGGCYAQIGRDDNVNSNGIGIGNGGVDYIHNGLEFLTLSSSIGWNHSGYFTNSQNWFHYVIVKSKNLVTYYLNGINLGSKTILEPLNPSNFIFFGASSPNSFFLNGKLDDIGIYSRALAQEEITALFKSCTNPIATIAHQSSTTFCEGNSVTLNASMGAGYIYEWFSNNIQINNASTSSYTSNISGNYTVKIIDGTCSTTSSITNVTVNPNPIVSLASLNAFINNNSNAITLVGTPSGGTYIGSGISGTSFNPKLAGLGNKTITYNYTNSNNCSGSATRSTIVFDTTGIVCSSTKYDTITTHISVTDTLIIKAHFAGLNNIIGTTEIKIYPNPTSDIIYINTGDFTQLSGSTIKITDALGKSVFSSLINQQLFTINTSQFGARGVYTVQIMDGNQIVKDTRKIVLQ